jgi:hypothetical protein
MSIPAGHWWFTPVILANQEAEIRRTVSKLALVRPYLEKTLHRKGP